MRFGGACRLVAFGTILSLLTPAALADQTYLCMADLSTGFTMRNGEWVSTNFTTSGDRFAVKVKNLDVSVTRIGDSYPKDHCSLMAPDSTQFACGGLGFGFVMNFQTLRFQDYYGIGYVDGRDDGQNTPSLTIGKCSPL